MQCSATAEGDSYAGTSCQPGHTIAYLGIFSLAGWSQHPCNCIALALSWHALDLVIVKYYRPSARHKHQPMLSMGAQLNAGVLSRFTRVRVIVPHAGAYVPYQAERIATAGRQGLSGGPERMAQLKRLYFDTAMSGEAACTRELEGSFTL